MVVEPVLMLFLCGEAKGSRSSVHNAVAEVCPFSGEFFSIPLDQDPGGFGGMYILAK